MSKKIVIIGSGSFGTAIAKVLYDGNNKNIVIYGVEKSELKDLANGKNSKYFPNIKFPKFKTTTNLEIAIKNAKIIVLAVPSSAQDKIFPKIVELITTDILIINVAKGFYPGKAKSSHEGMEEVSKNNKKIRGIVSLIGPSHAKEIVLSMPTFVASVNLKKKLCQEVKKLFSNSYFKVYIQTDIKGALVGAIYKNVIAIASGMINALGFKFNTTAALLTIGIEEMQRFNQHIGGKSQTIYGLTGIGDLIVTAMSSLSRNWTFGNEFIKNKSILTNKTVEGLSNLKYIYKIGKDNNLDLPIVYALNSIIFEKKDYKIIFNNLWNVHLKT